MDKMERDLYNQESKSYVSFSLLEIINNYFLIIIIPV